jgi:hypothetical protein
LITTGLHQRPVWQIESDAIRVAVTECGGHVAETTSKRTGVNPLWIQDRPTIDSDGYDPAVHGETYGTDLEAKLIAGLVGHNLCLPYWGPPSAAEFRAGMTYHGETNITRWGALEHRGESLRLEALLSESRIRVERTLRCAGPLLWFETIAENLTTWDRPIAWCEHVSFGPPFLAPQQTGFFAHLGKGYRTSGDWLDSFHWPEGRGEISRDLSGFDEEPHLDLVNSFQVEKRGEWACFAAWNARLGSLLGYAFRVSEFPWLNVWENNAPRRRTRGMEFSNTPIEGTIRQLVGTPRVYGIPTFEWLEAKSQLKKAFFSFSIDLPPAYQGVASIEFDGAQLTLEESGTGKKIQIST